MNLQVFERKLPLRAYPKKDLNKILITVFVPWLCKLLSLKDEVSADRLEMALPAIRTQCIGMGFDEVKKMFESYVDGHLPLEPRTNFFDRVLLGKIVKEWKILQHKKNPKKVEIMQYSESELFIINNKILHRFLEKYEKERFIDKELFYIYDILDKRKLTNTSLEYKNSIKKDAIFILEKETNEKIATSVEEQRNFKKDILAIKEGNFIGIKNKCKILALEEFFRNLYKDQNKLIKFKNSLK
tara:strand:+ start:1255 stop:1980 length:726 start_codon:yes stop_codon:yes gene_type:complete